MAREACYLGIESHDKEAPRKWKGVPTMCMSCSGGLPNDDHGDPRNITEQDLKQAAQAAGISPEEAAQNFMNAIQHLDFTLSASHTPPSEQQGKTPLP